MWSNQSARVPSSAAKPSFGRWSPTFYYFDKTTLDANTMNPFKNGYNVEAPGSSGIGQGGTENFIFSWNIEREGYTTPAAIQEHWATINYSGRPNCGPDRQYGEVIATGCTKSTSTLGCGAPCNGPGAGGADPYFGSTLFFGESACAKRIDVTITLAAATAITPEHPDRRDPEAAQRIKVQSYNMTKQSRRSSGQ